MASYNSLKATVNANIKANNNQEITGPVLNSVLNQMINSLGAGYQYMGVATPTNPGTLQTPDYNCFYLAATPGTYSYLGNVEVKEGEICLLVYNGSWNKYLTNAAMVDTYFVGSGMTLSRAPLPGLLNSGRYRITLNTTDFPGDVTQGYARFVIGYYDGSYHDIVVVSSPGVPEKYYDITVPAECDYVWVGGRATAGEHVKFSVEPLDLIEAFTFNRGAVKLLPAASGVPNIDTAANTIHFPNDSILVIGSNSYILPDTTANFKGGIASSATKLTFNTSTRTFKVYAYSAALSADEFVVGVFRTVYGVGGTYIDCNLPFAYTLDGKKYPELQAYIDTSETRFVASNAISQQLLNNYFVGAGNTSRVIKLYGLMPGGKYRVQFPQTTWDITGVTVGGGYGMLWIGYIRNGSQTLLKNVTLVEGEILPFYDIELPDEFDYVIVGGRATAGVVVRFNVEDITERFPVSTYPYNYRGERLDILANKWQARLFLHIPPASSHVLQSMVAYGDYIVTISPNYDEQISIYDIKSGTALARLSLSGIGHCNSATLGAILNSANSIMPLLYLSQYDGDKKCVVVDVQKTGSTFSVSIVQQISLSLPVSIVGEGPRDWAVDAVNGRLYCVGYTLGADTALAGNFSKVAVFNLPELVSGTDVVLGESNLLAHFTIAELIAYRQDMCVNGGKIIMAAGVPGTSETFILAVDMTGEIVTKIPLGQFGAGEPEGVAIYEDKLLFTFGTDERIYELMMK